MSMIDDLADMKTALKIMAKYKPHFDGTSKDDSDARYEMTKEIAAAIKAARVVTNGLRAALAEARKQGFVLVPVDATHDMMIAGAAAITAYVKDDETDSGDVYRAMISASPSIDEV